MNKINKRDIIIFIVGLIILVPSLYMIKNYFEEKENIDVDPIVTDEVFLEEGVYMVIDNHFYEVEIEENKLGKEFLDLLPLEIEMTELNGNEKYYRLGKKLSSDDKLVETINKGDLIYYYAVYSEKYIIKSDVVEEVKNDDYSSLYTIKDDKNSFNISSTKVLGKYATTYNKLGTVLDVIESKIGFLFLVLLPIMIIFIYQIYELVIVIRYERVDKDEQKDDKKTVKEDVKKPIKKDNQDDIEIL